MFLDRADAGRKLSAELKKTNIDNPFVMAIPRGGVIVGAEIARQLDAKLDIVVPRKIGSPYNSEVAIGAVAQDGSTYLDDWYVKHGHLPKEELNNLINREVKEIERRIARYRENSEYPDLTEKTIILVDDGAATGYTMMAAAEFVKNSLNPCKVIIALPVAPPDTLELFETAVDEVVCLYSPGNFQSVGQYYRDFGQTSDEEVISALNRFK